MRVVQPLDLDDVPDLPTIDLAGVGPGVGLMTPATDRRTFEDRYAELGFGLGTVPRRARRDDAFWETPTGILALLTGFITLLTLLTAAS